MRRIRIITPYFLLSFALAPTLALAQDTQPGPLLIGTAGPSAHATATDKSDLRVNVNMTLVPVTVLDSMGRSVTGLTPENFRVFDNKQPVSIASFARQDQPIAVGLIFDCSRSMADKFKTEREAPAELFRQLGPSDESFLITVSDRAVLRTALTTDLGLVANSLVFSHPRGTTPLLDGIQMGLHELQKSHLARKALIVVSDGGDNNSRYTLHEIEEMVAESNAQIFTVLLYNNPQAPEELLGPDLMAHLAAKSGGVNFTINNMADIHQTMTKIGISLHNQYLLGYYMPDDSHSGQYRRITVQLLLPRGVPRLILRAREGYYAP